MFARLTRSLLVMLPLALAAMFVLVVPALAGGWVVISLDRLPEGIVAGETTTVGMTARQHGQTAWEVDSLKLLAEHVETGQQVSFTALPEGEPGHYIAELVFPVAGNWEWTVSAGMFPEAQPMPALSVSADPALASGESGTGAASSLLAITRTALLGAGALLAFASGLVMILRARSRRLPGSQQLPMLAGAGLMVLCAGLAFASHSSANAQAKQNLPANSSNAAAVEDPVVVGQQLFLAKGCVVCHTNDRAIRGSESYGINMGPNLTQYKNDPNFIHAKLKDPKAMNPDAEMPQLYLKVDEIKALVAFINNHE